MLLFMLMRGSVKWLSQVGACGMGSESARVGSDFLLCVSHHRCYLVVVG